MRVAGRLLGLVFAVVLPAAVWPAAAPAQSSGAGSIAAFAKLDINEDGVLSGIEMKSIAAMDDDGNGRVTQLEYAVGIRKLRGGSSAEVESQFVALDKNEDGFLSGSEKSNLDKYDTDRDGEISKREFIAGRVAEQLDSNDEAFKRAKAAVEESLRQRALAIFKIQDTNSDERLSGTEITPDFAKFDADRNGRITREEYLAGVLAERAPGAGPAAPAPPGLPSTPAAPLENPGPAKPVARDGAAAAMQATAAYVKAFNADDVDGLLAVTGVPYIDDVQRVIKDRTELRTHFEKAVQGLPHKSQVIKAVKFGGIRSQVNSPEVLALFDQVLTPDDYMIEVGENGIMFSAAFVKIVDGRPVVVGWTK